MDWRSSEILKKAYDEYATLPALGGLRASGANFVPGDGPVPCPIMMVGEAPGATEDQERRPFVGQSGMYLNYLLETVHLDRSEVFITNVVKYRPPENRDPEPLEISASLPCLQEEILGIQPQVVCTVGRHALRAAFPDARLKIGDTHGKPWVYQGRWWLPLYHPAAALRGVVSDETMENDIRQLPTLIV